MSDSDDIYGRPKGIGSKIQTVLVSVLVGLLVLAFAVWGIEDVFSPNARNSIVKVGDAEVSQPEFMDRFNDEMQTYAEQNGEGLTNQQAYDRGIPQQLVARMQSDLAIEADANDLGVGVNNRNVRRYVEDIDAFRNEITQEFDEDQLEQLLRSNRISRDEFEDDIVRVLTQRQTLPAIMGGIQAPSDYARRYNTFVNEIRRGRLIRLTADSLDAVPEASDDDIRSYIAANRERFTAPEYRQILALKIEPTDFIGNDPNDPRFADAEDFPPEQFDIYITEDDIRARFDALVGGGQLGAAETRDVTIVSVPTEEQATVVASRLSAGEAAAAVATDLGLDTPNRFEGIEENGLINAASSEAAFELEEGQAKSAATDFGTYEVVYVDTVNAAEVPDFDAIRDELHVELIEGEAREKVGEYEKIVDDMLLEGATVEEIAEEIDFPLQAYPYLDRQGLTPNGVYMGGFERIPGIAQDRSLMNAIFAADIGFESEIMPTSNNGLAVFRVTDFIDAAPKPFEDVRDAAASALAAEALTEALTQKGIEVAQRLLDGEDFDAVASQLGVGVTDIVVQRANPPREYSPTLLVDFLGGDPGDVSRGPGATPGTYEVAVLDTVSAAGDQLGGQLLQQIQANVSEQIALDISTAYQAAILDDHEAQLFEDQLRAALALSDDGS